MISQESGIESDSRFDDIKVRLHDSAIDNPMRWSINEIRRIQNVNVQHKVIQPDLP
jgi:hypothetical protein